MRNAKKVTVYLNCDVGFIYIYIYVYIYIHIYIYNCDMNFDIRVHICGNYFNDSLIY